MRGLVAAAMLAEALIALGRIDAQPPAVIARDGWEAFPVVEYQGGDATQPKKRAGMLVLTDSTLALHECYWTGCYDFKKQEKPPFRAEPLYLIPLRAVREVSASSQVRGPSTSSRIAWGMLASDRTEEFVGLVYESASSAEAPVFKTMKSQSGAIEAKVRFRLKKLGVDIAP